MILARKPRYRVDLISLQAVCETNFARLRQLMPKMAEQDELRILLADQGESQQSLMIRVLERCPYTTTLQLSHESGALLRSKLDASSPRHGSPAFAEDDEHFSTPAFAEDDERFSTRAFAEGDERFSTRAFAEGDEHFSTPAFTENDGHLSTSSFPRKRESMGRADEGVFDEHRHDWLLPPSMEVRMYHDVCMAEVVAAYRRRWFRGVYPYPNEQMLQPDEKYQLNHFLGEWLGYCRRHGLSNQLVPIGR